MQLTDANMLPVKVCREGRNVLVTIDGVTKPCYQWAREFGIEETTVWYRIRAGWAPEAWFITPNGTGRLKTNEEQKKRGCHWCADFKRTCPHEQCPYHELDDVKSYNEYLKKADKNELLKLLAALEG